MRLNCQNDCFMATTNFSLSEPLDRWQKWRKNWLLQGGPLVIGKDWVILYLSRTYGDTRSVHLKYCFLSAAAGLKCVSSVSPFSFLFVKSNDMAEGRQVDIGTQSCRASFDDCNLDVGCQWRLPWRWTCGWLRTTSHTSFKYQKPTNICKKTFAVVVSVKVLVNV